MTGAKNLLDGGSYLSFKLPGNPGFVRAGINCVKVALNGRDTYDLEFGRVRGDSYKVVETKSDVYADMLRDVFTSVTGLETSLGTMGRIHG